MGDADDLRESGLGWGWKNDDGDVDYPSFHRPPPTRERWISRSKRRHQLVEDLEVEQLALQLIKVKQKLRKLGQKEAQLKQQLSETMPKMGWVSMTDHDGEYIVEHLARRRKPRLNTGAALRLISKKYGEDAALLIAEQCSEISHKQTAIYVRRFPHNDGDE
ncbi:MAG: hypothetical protein DRR42_21680 [Gammaproteobacteria bacterium]|nr:MAG: hypothetical protein DRR42_21680 [Gammaproteobacteria bacterium]